jgi:hypothetical protein
LSDVTGIGAAEAGEVAAGPSAADGDGDADSEAGLLSPGAAGLNGSLLKLNPNGFLQCAQRTQFLGSDQRQRAPG